MSLCVDRTTRRQEKRTMKTNTASQQPAVEIKTEKSSRVRTAIRAGRGARPAYA